MSPDYAETIAAAIHAEVESNDRIARLEAELAEMRAREKRNELGDEALGLLAQLLKERKGGEFEWMPTQALWRHIRAVCVEDEGRK